MLIRNSRKAVKSIFAVLTTWQTIERAMKSFSPQKSEDTFFENTQTNTIPALFFLKVSSLDTQYLTNETMKESYFSCNRAQIFQLKELDSSDIFCIVGSDGELGSGASSVVRLSIHGAFGDVAVKCFNVPGGDQDKRKIVKKCVP